QPRRRHRTVRAHIGRDRLKLFEGLIGPDYSPHLGRGSGLSVDRDFSQRTTASCVTKRPASISAIAFWSRASNSVASSTSKLTGSSPNPLRGSLMARSYHDRSRASPGFNRTG